MGDYSPVYATGDQMTYTAGGTITGGQFVAISANDTVVAATTALAGAVIGLAANDAVSGQRVTVHGLDLGHEVVTGTGGLTAGQPVKTDNAGLAVAYVVGTDPVTQYLGVCTRGATAGNKARFVGR